VDTPRVTLIVGRTQQGKSTLALKMALKEFPRVIVLDSARTKVFDQIADGGQFQTWPELATWLMSEAGKHPRWCVALRSKNPEDYAALLLASEHFRGILLLLDETHKLCRMEGVMAPLELVALTGAHYGNGAGVWLYMVSQRPTSVPINIRSQADRIITFRQQEPRDRQWLIDWGTTQEFSDAVGQLPDHQHMIYPPPGGEQGNGRQQRNKSVDVPDSERSTPTPALVAPSGSTTVTPEQQSVQAAVA
jgi:hypothetical protein